MNSFDTEFYQLYPTYCKYSFPATKCRSFDELAFRFERFCDADFVDDDPEAFCVYTLWLRSWLPRSVYNRYVKPMLILWSDRDFDVTFRLRELRRLAFEICAIEHAASDLKDGDRFDKR